MHRRLIIALLLATPVAAVPPPPSTVLAQALGDYAAGRFDRARVGFTALADQGSAIGETMLGTIYARGQGVAADPATGASYWLRAANRNYGPAQLALARALAAGRGVARDPDAAWLWASLAARGPDPAIAAAARAFAADLRRTQTPARAAALDHRLDGWRPWTSNAE